MSNQQVTSGEFLKLMKDRMAGHAVMHHPFLLEFERSELNNDQLKQFAVQWYKTARAHKEAFPAIVYNTQDDDVRFDLIEILNEEYGNGDREKIHARLLLRLLTALGISPSDVDATEALPGVQYFSHEVSRIWRTGKPIYAFGVHFALEFLASSLHVHFSNGLNKYTFLREYDKEYFNYHRTAEKHHADFSERGFLQYANNRQSQVQLGKGVDKATHLMTCLWDDFYRLIFESTSVAAA